MVSATVRTLPEMPAAGFECSLLQIQLPENADPQRQQVMVQQLPASHMGDPDESLGFWLQLFLVLAVVDTGE